jgi:hypothetical protein
MVFIALNTLNLQQSKYFENLLLDMIFICVFGSSLDEPVK